MPGEHGQHCVLLPVVSFLITHHFPMKAGLMLLILCSMGTAGYAQSSSPFWGALAGPPGPILSTLHRPDSSAVVAQVGGAVYIYDSSTKSWIPANGFEQAIGLGERSYGHMAVAAHYWLPNVFASYKDTAFYSLDSGVTWKRIGVFGSGGEYSIKGAITATSRIVFVDDSNRIYSSSDSFSTIDTQRTPDVVRSLYMDQDTIFCWSVYGTLYRTRDWGRTWSVSFQAKETGSNWFSKLCKRDGRWILIVGEVTKNFPQRDTNVHVVRSFDKGKEWSEMSMPITGEMPIVSGMDKDQRIYLWFGRSFQNYRSDDWGASWHKLMIADPGIYVDKEGNAFSGNLVSLNHGDTWQAISIAHVACLPACMLSFGDASVVAAKDEPISRLYSSSDAGNDWWLISNSLILNGGLSLRPDSAGWVMFNTTRKLSQSGASSYLCQYNNVPSEGIGTITSSFHVWLSDYHGSWIKSVDSSGVLRDFFSKTYFLKESRDTGCSYHSILHDTLSSTPILQVIESANDTILALSASGVFRGFDSMIPFDTVTPKGEINSTPTGAIMKDSTGGIYVAMTDGKLFVTTDGARSWQSFVSPVMGDSAVIKSMAAAPNGVLFACDSNVVTGETQTWQYEPRAKAWKNISSGLTREGFSFAAVVTQVFYVNGFAYAGTWNMGLFRSRIQIASVEGGELQKHGSPLQLYPDPASTYVTLTYPVLKGDIAYRLVDITGRLRARGILARNSSNTKINITDLANGHYEIIVDAPWRSSKFVVRR